ncbi:P63C domain-containing protein [Leucobacter sp. gxy201]|uniref:P63C domain-containing protein n=1 Tax=Leucobacter sp. gxy201 TaxID=2957200 RepID=UPI003DA03B5F
MTPAERSESARKAAAARWEAPAPLNIISGSPDTPLVIGGVEVECYVLEGGQRVISQGGMMTALGRSRRLNTKPGDDTSLPPILRISALREHLSDRLIEESEPITFLTAGGKRANGYRAEVLPQLCEAWLAARSAGDLVKSQLPIAHAAELIVRGLARVGIIALVDEATGYQDTRAKDALAKILEAYVTEELQPWVKTFDLEWYKQMFRLRGIPFDPESVKRPPYFGHLTNNTVYKRLAPGVFEQIKIERERDAKKKRAKMHQQLTAEIGHPRLREHIASITTIMKLSDDWNDYIEKLDRIHPIIDPNMPPALFDTEPDSGTGL